MSEHEAKERALLKFSGALCRVRGTDTTHLADTAEYALFHYLYTHLTEIDAPALLAANPPPAFSQIMNTESMKALLDQHPHMAEQIQAVYRDIEIHSKGNSTARDYLAVIAGIAEGGSIYTKSSIITTQNIEHKGHAKPTPPSTDVLNKIGGIL